MRKFRNLVPDSAPIQEIIELLRANGGRASCVDIAEAVLQLPGLDPQLAALVLADFIEGEGDWRLRVSEDACEVEMLCEDDECRQLVEADFVVFDVETTGPKTPPCRIMELGAIRVSRGRIVAEFQTLLNPLMPIPPFIASLTGISDSMVSTAPTFDEVAADWLDFADTAVLVAHNAPFDVRFINHELSRLYPGQRMVNPHLCTVSLARRVMPELSSFRLAALAEHFAVQHRSRHRAGDDARATAEVFILLLEHLGRHGVQDLAGARRFKKQLTAAASDSRA